MYEEKKRLNIEIDVELHKQLKIAAAKEGITIAQMVREGIEKRIKENKK